MNTLKVIGKKQETPEAPEGIGIEGSSIGKILVHAGRLTPQDLLRIMALQSKDDILFGDAAVGLGILSEEDIRWALANQYSYPCSEDIEQKFAQELLVIKEPYKPCVESFRSIRSALILSGAGKLFNTIGILSPGEGEGKTFIAANLAVVCAQLGSRTLLVDLNFRSPRIHTLFQMKNNCGASSLIIKRALITEAVQKTAIAALDILPSGPRPPNPLELLSWEDTRQLFSTLKEQYEVVIIDTPAFNQKADSLIISKLCEGSLLIALKGKTTNAAFGQVKKQLDTAGAKILGAVVNEMEAKK